MFWDWLYIAERRAHHSRYSRSSDWEIRWRALTSCRGCRLCGIAVPFVFRNGVARCSCSSSSRHSWSLSLNDTSGRGLRDAPYCSAQILLVSLCSINLSLFFFSSADCLLCQSLASQCLVESSTWSCASCLRSMYSHRSRCSCSYSSCSSSVNGC